MTSNPSHRPPGRPERDPAASEPLEGLPLPGDGFPVPDGRWHTGPLGPVHTGPLSRVQAGPQGHQPGGGRWPTTRAPWPGPASEQTAADTGEPRITFPGEERLATLSYLSVPFLGPLVPLFVFLTRKRSSPFVRSHSVQALNLSITALISPLCALILGTMLSLDSVTVALIFVLPLAAALWLVTLVYLILAASRAGRGDYLRIPSWLCATIVR
jgi:uncharacterized Tic20 family protein